MPLDTGRIEDVQPRAGADGAAALRIRPARTVLAADGDIGSALRAAREALDLNIDDIAQATRVRAAYIAALEAHDLDKLPARPFAIGYVRAYARALGVDAEAVVARFRRETPDPAAPLGAPFGALGGGSRRVGRWAAGLAVVVAALVTWNLVRHAQASPRPASRRIAAPAPARLQAGPTHLGAPLPTPPEAATPAAYQTPGLAPPESAIAASPGTGEPFAAAGAVYGAPPPGSGLILQARRSTSLVVRGAGGTVYFARQLAAGEAWRAPATTGLIADVATPGAMEAFADGASIGPLTQPQTALSSLRR